MMIDSYAYIGFWPYWPIKVRKTEELIALMDKWSIDKAVISSTRSIFTFDFEGGNREVYEAVKKFPDRLVGCAVIDLGDEDSALKQISSAVDLGMRGIRLYPLYNGYSLKKVSQKVINALVDASLPVAIPYRIIMNWGLPRLSPDDIENFSEKLSGTDIIICAANYGELAPTLEIMRKNDHVHLETSCLQTWGGVKVLTDMFGADRILLGIGMPLQYPACGITKVQHADISDKERKLIMSGNAERIFKL